MSASGSRKEAAIGFLTVVDHGNDGCFGGYLVLNTMGRPLEFHCTAPVKANRAQEILYGSTLRPFLYGEQIGKTLVEKSKISPTLLFTDVEPAMSLRPFTQFPVVLVGSNSRGKTGQASARIDSAHASTPPPAHSFTIAGQSLSVPADVAEDERQVCEFWKPHADQFDLHEPFSRIREAIDEAQRNAR